MDKILYNMLNDEKKGLEDLVDCRIIIAVFGSFRKSE